MGRVRNITALIVSLLLLGGSALAAASATSTPRRPNIVFVLTDDLATNLISPRYTPHIWALSRKGARFTNYYVTDSLCCPSRASIFTGRLPHDTGVVNNSGPHGGYDAFNDHHDQTSTVATDLSAAGYQTAMMGKYLNRYHTNNPKAPGWNTWDVVDWGYPEFNYSMNQNGRVVNYGGPNVPGKVNYLTTVLSQLADGFAAKASTRARPFFLEVATFAPHDPYTPAPAFSHLYPDLRYPVTPAFDAASTNPPEWLKGIPPLSNKGLAAITTDFRKRVQSMKSVDELVGSLEATLRRSGALANTYFVFSSDNGLHMGEHRLRPGKLTAFDTDIHVPLIVAGPRIAPDSAIRAFAQNIDLRSTIDALAHARTGQSVDGQSLTPLLLSGTASPPTPSGWRQGALAEHVGPVFDRADPDRPDIFSGNPPSYVALRLANALYVQYQDGEHEYYNLVRDPYELHNVYSSLPLARRQALKAEVAVLEHCHNQPACSNVHVG